MLEQYYRRSYYVRRIERLFRPQTERLICELQRQGYGYLAIQSRLTMIGDFVDWVLSNGILPSELRQAEIDKFVCMRRELRQEGPKELGIYGSFKTLVGLLRSDGVIPPGVSAPAAPSRTVALLRGYREFLDRQRGVTETTTKSYCYRVQALLSAIVKDDDPIGSITALTLEKAIRDLAKTCAPGTAKAHVNAMRSFLT